MSEILCHEQSTVFVSPFEVESALAGWEAVQEAAVVPVVFHGLLRPVAFVLHEGE